MPSLTNDEDFNGALLPFRNLVAAEDRYGRSRVPQSRLRPPYC